MGSVTSPDTVAKDASSPVPVETDITESAFYQQLDTDLQNDISGENASSSGYLNIGLIDDIIADGEIDTSETEFLETYMQSLGFSNFTLTQEHKTALLNYGDIQDDVDNVDGDEINIVSVFNTTDEGVGFTDLGDGVSTRSIASGDGDFTQTPTGAVEGDQLVLNISTSNDKMTAAEQEEKLQEYENAGWTVISTVEGGDGGGDVTNIVLVKDATGDPENPDEDTPAVVGSAATLTVIRGGRIDAGSDEETQKDGKAEEGINGQENGGLTIAFGASDDADTFSGSLVTQTDTDDAAGVGISKDGTGLGMTDQDGQGNDSAGVSFSIIPTGTGTTGTGTTGTGTTDTGTTDTGTTDTGTTDTGTTDNETY